jgi:hypothetical protein
MRIRPRTLLVLVASSVVATACWADWQHRERYRRIAAPFAARLDYTRVRSH